MSHFKAKREPYNPTLCTFQEEIAHNVFLPEFCLPSKRSRVSQNRAKIISLLRYDRWSPHAPIQWGTRPRPLIHYLVLMIAFLGIYLIRSGCSDHTSQISENWKTIRVVILRKLTHRHLCPLPLPPPGGTITESVGLGILFLFRNNMERHVAKSSKKKKQLPDAPRTCCMSQSQLG